MIKIAFLGKMHSGKTTAVNKIWELAESVDLWPMLVKIAKPLYDAQELFIGKDEKNRIFLQELSTLSKKCFGQDILSRCFTERIERLERDFPQKRMVLLCDDIRVPTDFETAKECGFTIVGINASDEARRKRNPKLFVGTEHETENQVDVLMKKTDIVVDGDLEIDAFRYDIHQTWIDLVYKAVDDDSVLNLYTKDRVKNK